MNQINSLLLVITVIIVFLLFVTTNCKKEKFTLNDNLSEIEKKIKQLEFAMTGMKDNHNAYNLNNYINNERKPYKIVYNYY